MGMKSTQQAMRRVQWNANKRTVEKRALVPFHVKEEADTLLGRGDYEGARSLLEGQEASALARDHAALITLGLVHFGQHDYDGALAIFDKAEAAINHVRARILLNRANVLKVQKRYEQALQVSLEVRELAPQWSASHLMILAVLECSGCDENRTAVLKSVDHMTEVWPEWREDPEFWGYLMTDVDYSNLRKWSEFGSVFGAPPTKGDEENV